MTAAVLEKAGQLVVREMEKTAPNSGEILAQACYCGICGMDLKMFRGGKNWFRENLALILNEFLRPSS